MNISLRTVLRSVTVLIAVVWLWVLVAPVTPASVNTPYLSSLSDGIGGGMGDMDASCAKRECKISRCISTPNRTHCMFSSPTACNTVAC